MPSATAVVVTSISPPNPILRSIAEGCAARAIPFFLIGDVRSPADFALDGCDFYSLARQAETGLRTAALVPQRHYARKNIGYLLAARAGVEQIVETDDDNIPREGFWRPRSRRQTAALASQPGWLNVYRYFTDAHIWPRGLPLDEAVKDVPNFASLPGIETDCPIQQGLADDNPDVDAIYRLLLPLPQSFRADRAVALGSGVWCPFNSQNTTFWRDAFPLLYLPAYCSFRMTDIWRSLIAQRICWENGWNVLFHEPTVSQLRNDHNLMRDFEDEVPGYLQNRRIADLLSKLSLSSDGRNIGANLYRCYEHLVSASILEQRELELVEAWLEDLGAAAK